jgi:hypothetical protein
MVFSLLGMAAKLATVAIETEVAIGIVLDEASALVQETAKNALGTDEFGWPPLKEATVARKATGDSPLLETGELRDSIERTVGRRSAWVGSDLDNCLDGVRHVNNPAAEFYRERRDDLRAADTRDGRRDGRRRPGRT